MVTIEQKYAVAIMMLNTQVDVLSELLNYDMKLIEAAARHTGDHFRANVEARADISNEAFNEVRDDLIASTEAEIEAMLAETPVEEIANV